MTNFSPLTTEDREHAKFKKTASDEVAVRTCIDQDPGSPVPVTFAASAVTVKHFDGTVGTTAINVPGSAGEAITLAFVHNPKSNAKTDTLSFSFDSGATFTILKRGDSIIWPVNESINQVKIKSNVADTDYEIILNRVV